MTFSPDGRLFFSVKDAGEIQIMMPNGSVLLESFVRLHDNYTHAHQEILGITLDPSFPTNHYVYAYARVKDSRTGDFFNRVIRFTELENKATDEKILVDNIPAGNGIQFAGALAFGLDGKVYVTTDYNINQEKQLQNSSLAGKVLRINREGTIPIGNPFPNLPIYRQRHRNAFGIPFDKLTGIGIVVENDPAR